MKRHATVIDEGPPTPKHFVVNPSWPFLRGWIGSYVDRLPDELLCKCKPLFCELCAVRMNSAPQAKIHYEGKVHDKHAKHFLDTWARENQTFMPRKKGLLDPEKPTYSGKVSALDLHCHECNLSFTSVVNLEQHRNGRNHKRQLTGQTKLISGYFNQYTNKWQRNPPNETIDTNPNLHVISPPVPVSPFSSCQNLNSFFCDLCQVGATSQAQLDMHLMGKSHKSKMNMNQKVTSLEPVTARATIIRAKLTKDETKKDFSIFRTPSGQFYCSSCNVCVNSELQFKQHVESKKHKLKGKKK